MPCPSSEKKGRRETADSILYGISASIKRKNLADNVNWAKLTAQGRCKAIGIPWTEEELKAVYKLKIPVDYVRQGILTIKDYEKELSKDKKAEKKGEEKPLEKLKKEELLKKAKDLGIKIADEKAVSKGDLLLELKKK